MRQLLKRLTRNSIKKQTSKRAAVLGALILSGGAATLAWKRSALLGAVVVSGGVAAPVLAQNTTANEGGDLAFGGPGTEAGKFQVLNDIIFDPKGVLYALEGSRMDGQTKTMFGNLRVQKFDRTGKVVGAIDLKSAPGIEWNEKNQPARVAADSLGNVYVTVPGAGQVLQFDNAGQFVRSIAIPRARDYACGKRAKRTHRRCAAKPRSCERQMGFTRRR